MANPKVLGRNILALSKAGRGDGTIYASGPSAVVDVDAKTFDLSTITFISDLTEADDILIGYELVFTTSGNTYLITDYVASTDVATVRDTPIATDTGAYEVRRTLYTANFDPAYPVRNASNGRLYKTWKDDAITSAIEIYAPLPNAMDDGGFELNSLADFWTIAQAGTGTVAINPTAPLLGTYDVKMNKGDQTYVLLSQVGKVDLLPGRSYGVVFKASGDGGAVTDLRVTIIYEYPGSSDFIPVTFTKINAGDALGDIGNGTDNEWKPAIADSELWEEITFTVPDSLNAGEWRLQFRQYDSTDVFLDEIYVFEVVQADTFVLGNHNAAGGFTSASHLRGARCMGDLTSFSPDDYDLLIDLDADVQVDGNSPLYEKFTPGTELYPVYSVYFSGVFGQIWEVGEIWIGREWDWARPPNRLLTSVEDTVSSIQSYSRAHVGVGELLAQYREYRDTVQLIDSTEVLKWKAFLDNNGYGAPFWLIVPADADLGQAEEVIFMRCPKAPFIVPELPGYYRASFSFEEAF